MPPFAGDCEGVSAHRDVAAVALSICPQERATTFGRLKPEALRTVGDCPISRPQVQFARVAT
jgi:hypothetical protein